MNDAIFTIISQKLLVIEGIVFLQHVLDFALDLVLLLSYALLLQLQLLVHSQGFQGLVQQLQLVELLGSLVTGTLPVVVFTAEDGGHSMPGGEENLDERMATLRVLTSCLMK